jgi:hypothetical protein
MKHILEHWECGCCEEEFNLERECIFHEAKKKGLSTYGGRVYPRMEDPTRCWDSVRGCTGDFYQCSRKRGHGKDGLYCKQHAKANREGM